MKNTLKTLFTATVLLTGTAQATNTFSYVEAYLKGSQLVIDEFDKAGTSVAIDGDIMVVGVPREDGSYPNVYTTPFSEAQDNSASTPDAGAAYVFERSTLLGIWEMTAYLKAHNPGANDGFGHQVAISGDTIVVTAENEDSSLTEIANFDNPLIIAPPADNDSAISSGAAYVYVRNGSGDWRLQSYLKADLGAGQQLGSSATIDSERIVLGAKNNAVVFERSSFSNPPPFPGTYAGWTQTATLSADNTDNKDDFGVSVDLDGDTLAIGASGEDSDGSNGANNDLENSGAAYVFYYDGSSWVQQAYLKSANRDDIDYFGRSVAIDDGNLAVGAPYENSNGYSRHDNSMSDGGAVYLFTRLGSGSSATWVPNAPTHYLKAPVVSRNMSFGGRLALDNGRLVVGVPSESGNSDSPHDVGQLLQSGAVYVFEQVPQSGGFAWPLRAYLKASNLDEFDRFGSAVAIDDGDIAVGAPGESGNGSAPTNNSDHRAGAAYYFGFGNAISIPAGFYTIGGGLVNVPNSGIGISNGGNYITVTGDSYGTGRFTFPSPVNGNYNVQVDASSVPSDLTCWVENGSGSTVGVGEVYDIWVVCTSRGHIFRDSFEAP